MFGRVFPSTVVSTVMAAWKSLYRLSSPSLPPTMKYSVSMNTYEPASSSLSPVS